MNDCERLTHTVAGDAATNRQETANKRQHRIAIAARKIYSALQGSAYVFGILLLDHCLSKAATGNWLALDLASAHGIIAFPHELRTATPRIGCPSPQ